MCPKSLYLATPLTFKPPDVGVAWDDLRKNSPRMSTDGQGTKCRKDIVGNFNRLSRVYERYRRQRTDDRQTTDGRATAYSERERDLRLLKSKFQLEHK